jgi:murein DD-endopeptidase MepM/ murein hydrolase activator NlpD
MLHLLVTASLLANVPARGGSASRVAFGALFATLLIVTGAPNAVAATPTATAVPALEIRFCPAARVHPWPAADARQLNTLLLQNVAIVNRSAATATLESVSLQLLSKGTVVDERHFDAAALERIGARGAALQKSGVLRLVAFQFCGTEMIGADVELAGRTLAPAQALLIAQQAFTYPGARDALRVRAQLRTRGKSRTIDGSIPIHAATPVPAMSFPVRGAWYVASGASFHTAHRWAVPEEFALDLVRLGADGRTHVGDGARFEDYHAYGADVLAAAGGRVVVAHDGESEDPSVMRKPGEAADAYFARLQGDQTKRLLAGANAVAGNYVFVEHADGVLSMYAHLKPGSVRVRAGDVVSAGQPLGLLGSSGNSTEPHLHFQVCDRADPLMCAGRPMSFSDVVLPLSDEPRALQSGDVVLAN